MSESNKQTHSITKKDKNKNINNTEEGEDERGKAVARSPSPARYMRATRSSIGKMRTTRLKDARKTPMPGRDNANSSQDCTKEPVIRLDRIKATKVENVHLNITIDKTGMQRDVSPLPGTSGMGLNPTPATTTEARETPDRQRFHTRTQPVNHQWLA